MTEIHGYFAARARAAFSHHGGDPDLATPLAEWAAAARQASDRGCRDGVIVAETGEIVAETRYYPGAHAAYVVPADAARWGLLATEVGMARSQIERQLGARTVQIRYSEVCLGAARRGPLDE
jgi:hypothetical protein